MSLSGIWLPIITPFQDGKVDYAAYEKLLKHYIGKGIAGLIPLGTTGESPVLDEDEMEKIIDITVATVNKKIPVYVGLGGSATFKVLKLAKKFEKYGFDGFLAVCPYYNRPSQEGLRQHFTALAEATAKKIIIYNVSYRTGVNLQNDTLFNLLHLKNIVGIKDCCGNMTQSLELLASKPANFAVFTGEDALLFTMLAQGAEGGILASAHLDTPKFLKMFELMKSNQHMEAREIWGDIARISQLLFKQPSPAPVKYCLAQQGLIPSAEVRLPLTSITKELEQELKQLLKQTAPAKL